MRKDMRYFTVYTDKQIEKVCEMLQDNNMPLTTISSITGVLYEVVLDILCGIRYRDISKKYDFSSHPKIGPKTSSSKYSEDEIHRVCKMLEDQNNTINYISIMTGVSKSTIYSIINHKTWKHVSCQYDFPKRCITSKMTIAKKKKIENIEKRILDLIYSGYIDEDIIKLIYREFGDIGDFNIDSSISYMRRKYL